MMHVTVSRFMAENNTVAAPQDFPSPPPYTVQPARAAPSTIQTQPGYTGQPPQPGYPVKGGYPPQQPQYPEPHPFGAQPVQPAQLGFYPQPVQTFQPTSTVIMEPGLQTSQANIVPVAPRPPSYIGLSIFNLMSCNPVLGTVAITYSNMVDSAYDRGDYEEARRNSNIAKWLNIVSLVLGIGIIIFIIIWFAVIVGSAVSTVT